MILVSHPTGNAFARHALVAFQDEGWLAEFWTCIAWNRQSGLARLAPKPLIRQLNRRSFEEVERGRIRTRPVQEAIRLCAPHLGLGGLARHEVGPFSVDSVFCSMDRTVARRVARASGLRAVYAYEDGAAETFRAAEERGIARLYDLPIGYWRAGHEIYREEIERMPEWAATIEGVKDSPEKLARKDEELALADLVVVASSFTASTLAKAPRAPSRVVTVPYGAPPAIDEEQMPRPSGDKLKVLFVGSLGQRKGTAYLLEAVRMLGNRVELTLLGSKPAGACEPLERALRTFRWIPGQPHAEVLETMRVHDVLVFPSLFEGFGLVVLEAMSQGLPVIATANTCAPDVITDGEDGFVAPIRSAEAVAQRLDLLASDAERLRAMKMAALATARRRSWDGYRRGMVAAVAPFVGASSG